MRQFDSPLKARYAGFRPLSGPYSPQEQWMIDNITRDFTHSDCDLAEVETGVEQRDLYVRSHVITSCKSALAKQR